MGSPSIQRKLRRRKRNGRLMPPMHLKLCFSMASTALEELCRVSLKVTWIWVSPDGTCTLRNLECFKGESRGQPLKGYASSGNSMKSPAATANRHHRNFQFEFWLCTSNDGTKAGWNIL
jgi:hypothetical protein